MSARTDIATAASTVAGVNVTPNYRQDLGPGQGFVRFEARTRSSNGAGFMNTWQVWLALPQDLVTAETWLEANIDALVDAVSTAMVVTTVTPNELVLGAGNKINGVVIEGARSARE